MSDETDRHAKAYALWEKEGRPDGRDLDHWHKAGVNDADGVADEQWVDQTEASGSEDPAEGSEQIVDRELARQDKRPKRGRMNP